MNKAIERFTDWINSAETWRSTGVKVGLSVEIMHSDLTLNDLHEVLRLARKAAHAEATFAPPCRDERVLGVGPEPPYK